VRTADFDYLLPPELIAQHPAPVRDASRMLVLHRKDRRIEHSHFDRLPGFLRPGDLLVLNNSKVVRARLRGVNASTGGQFEILLVEENSTNDWWAMMRPGKRARTGTRILLRDGAGELSSIQAVVAGSNTEGHRRVVFEGAANIFDELERLGEVPLPPYIERVPGSRDAEDVERYQTVFAGPPGSVAAPTAGLHFTKFVLDRLRERQVEIRFVTLHVGIGTFAPVKVEELTHHEMHEERYELPADTAEAIVATKRRGGRVVAVGTTTLRVLESAALHDEELLPGPGKTKLFVYPPREFRVVDGLLTNFHLPRSTLLMLVSAFAAPGSLEGRELLLSAYSEAVREKYRFFSYGDAMLLI
jgi:S-adenosylmethionine:tRNA ribosyltransferase-isomerase